MQLHTDLVRELGEDSFDDRPNGSAIGARRITEDFDGDESRIGTEANPGGPLGNGNEASGKGEQKRNHERR
jgi:hypothetical protein